MTNNINYYTPIMIEWLHCIISPAHAKNTWLRIDKLTEYKALKIVKIIAIVISIGAIFSVGLFVGELRIIKLIENGKVPVSVQK